jgi:hypothetical protein
LGAELQLIILAAFAEGVAAEPEQACLEPGQFVRGSGFESGHRTALDKDLFCEGDADGFAGLGSVRWEGRSSVRSNVRSWSCSVRTEAQAVTHAERPGFDATDQDATVIESIDILDGESEGLIDGRSL